MRLVTGLMIVAVLLGGCAVDKPQAFNREAVSLKTMAVVEPQDQEQYSISILAHPGAAFGLVGGLIAAADMSAKTDRVTKALDPAQTQLQHRFSERLKERLATGGYQVVGMVDQPKGKDKHSALATRLVASNDAIVLTDLKFGYVAAGAMSNYLPSVIASVDAYSAKGELLYHDTIAYGYPWKNQSVHLLSDDKYQFKDVDALVANTALAREGLEIGVDAVAGQISSDLAR